MNKIDLKFPGKSDLASLNQAQIAVRLPALLSGNVEMQSVVVDGLNLNLIKGKDGQTNWAVAEQKGSDKKAESNDSGNDSSDSSESGPALAINIDSIQISNGNIRYLDETTATEAKISNFNMLSGQVVTNAFFPIELSFNATQSVSGEQQISADGKLKAELFLNLEQQQYKVKGLDSQLTLAGKPLNGNSLTLATAADIDADLATQALNLNNLKLGVANLNASGAIAVKNFAAPEISGNLNVAAFDLNKLLASLGQAAVKTTDPNVLKAISFNTELSGPANTVTAKTLQLKLDDTSFNGDAAFNLANGNISLNLQGDKLNADRYMPPASENKAAGGNTEAQASSSNSQGYPKDPILPIDTLKGLELDTKIGLSQLHVSNMDVSNIVLQVNAHGGLIKAIKIDADMYNGSVRNNVTIDVRKPTPVITSQKTISGIQIGDMLKAMADVDQLTGALNSKSNITVRGNSVHDFVNSMTGTANVSMKDGELHGIDMAQTVCQGMNNVSSLGVDTQEVDRSTPFANLGASARIKNGVINNPDMKAALDAMVLSGKGTVNLPKQLLDYRLGFMGGEEPV